MIALEYNRIISEYESLLSKVDELVENSPFKLSYIIEKMQMTRTTFYNKRKQASFNTDELKKLFSIIDEDPAVKQEKEIITNLLRESQAQYEKGEFRPFKDIIRESLKKYE